MTASESQQVYREPRGPGAVVSALVPPAGQFINRQAVKGLVCGFSFWGSLALFLLQRSWQFTWPFWT